MNAANDVWLTAWHPAVVCSLNGTFAGFLPTSRYLPAVALVWCLFLRCVHQRTPGCRPVMASVSWQTFPVRYMKVSTGYGGVLRISLGIFAVAMAFAFLTSGFSPTKPKKPDTSIFTAETGVAVGKNWELLSSGNDHGGMMGDGETFFVFRLPQADVAEILNSPPPWSDDWQTGPVEHEIGFHCNFGTSGVSWHSSAGVDEYLGDPTLKSVLSSGQIRYDAKERCCDSLRWHNGHLLVIDPENSQVWLSIWDF